MQVLVLASQSQYRAELLGRLNLDFLSVSPKIDETPKNGENPTTLATRLAFEKANAPSVTAFAQNLAIESTTENNLPEKDSAESNPMNRAIIIASDQVAALGNHTMGKPGTALRACEQLQAMSGQAVDFHTSLHMLDTVSGEQFSWLDTTVARLRTLSADEIERYIEVDQPLDCAGSFKMETIGISLFDSVQTSDPTALIGLPMIALCRGLRTLGVPVP